MGITTTYSSDHRYCHHCGKELNTLHLEDDEDDEDNAYFDWSNDDDDYDTEDDDIVYKAYPDKALNSKEIRRLRRLIG